MAASFPLDGDTVRPSASDSAALRQAPLPPEVAAAPGEARFGNFVRVAKLGAGGMGEVWKAWDLRLARWVALKFLTGGDETEIARFLQEAQVAGTLSHPNICAVHEASEAHGRHFIAMQFVDGVTAGKLPREAALAARVARDAARAVAEAHRRGVVHRDLKPENLMAARRAGSDDWHVYVMDFGLARRTEAASSLSISGAILGTPQYMPPEQARGAKADARADVWSLGATLYALLGGRPPFTGPSVYDILKSVQESEPPPLPAAIALDLRTIVAKCLEKDPARRYASADELADDLDRFVNGEPVAARPASLARRVVLRLARRRGLVVTAGLAAAAVALALALLVPPLFRERDRRARTEEALRLWTRVAPLLTDAELLDRNGRHGERDAKLVEAAAECRRHIETRDSAEARFFLGRILRRQGEGDAAVVELTRALELNPSMGEARIERGLVRLNRYDRILAGRKRELMSALGPGQAISAAAVAELERELPELAAARTSAIADLSATAGLSSWFSAADAEYGRAMLAMISGDHAEARRRLEALARTDPSHVVGLLKLADVLFTLHEIDDVIQICEQILSQHQGISDARVFLAETLRLKAIALPDDPARAAWLRRAHEEATAAVDSGRSDAWALSMLGLCRSELGDYRGALEALDRAAEAPHSDDTIISRGVVKRHLADVTGAMGDFDAVLKARPDSVGALFNRASLKCWTGDHAGAIADYREAIRLQPVWKDARVNVGKCLIELERNDEALAELDRILADFPGYPVALNNRGMLLSKLGRHEEALADLDAALRARPRYAQALINRGVLRWKVGRHAAAVEDLNAAISFGAPEIECRFTRGLALVELDRGEEAVADLRAAANDPRYVADANFALGNVWAARGDAKRAEEHFRAAVERAPKMFEAWFNLGIARLQTFSFKDAVKALDRAIELDPKHYGSYACRGWARQMQRKWKSAERDYVRALELAPPDWTERAETEMNLRTVRRKQDED